jgi:hypothetical protein
MPKADLAFTALSNKGDIEERTYAGALSFLRRRYSKDLTDVDVAVVGVPFDLATTNRPGARFGPAAIRAASAIMAWDRPYGWDYDPRERLAIVDYGDVSFDFGKRSAFRARSRNRSRRSSRQAPRRSRSAATTGSRCQRCAQCIGVMGRCRSCTSMRTQTPGRTSAGASTTMGRCSGTRRTRS